MSSDNMRDKFEAAFRREFGWDINEAAHLRGGVERGAEFAYGYLTRQAEERYKPLVEAAEAMLHERDKMVEGGQYNALAGVAHKLRQALNALEPAAEECDRDSRILAELCERGRVVA